MCATSRPGPEEHPIGNPPRSFPFHSLEADAYGHLRGHLLKMEKPQLKRTWVPESILRELKNILDLNVKYISIIFKPLYMYFDVCYERACNSQKYT